MSSVLLTTCLLLTLNFLGLVSCMDELRKIPSSEGLLMEDKMRLGSIPPNCYNRCNECNPCIAVQVPSIPVHSNKQNVATDRLSGARPSYDQYTDYKPLGWKCRCGSKLFDP